MSLCRGLKRMAWSLECLEHSVGLEIATHVQTSALHAVQEAQRMYSVAPLVVRKALQDVQIGQYTIPKGTAMILHVFAMHNTSANYERHTEFLPVRFSSTHALLLCIETVMHF